MNLIIYVHHICIFSYIAIALYSDDKPTSRGESDESQKI